MKLIVALSIALGLANGASAQAPAKKLAPPVIWAGCAGALTAKTMRLKASENPDDRMMVPLTSQMGRHALAQAKRVENPDKLTEAQIDGLAMASASSYYKDLAQNPAKVPEFEKAVTNCMDAISKLPG